MRALLGSIRLGALSIVMAIYGCNDNSTRPESTLQFGVVVDVQYAQKPTAMGRHYARSLEMLSRCVDNFNQTRPTFVIQLGDFVEGGLNAQRELQDAVAAYDTLTMPHYHVLGNHDFEGLNRGTTMRTLGLTKSWYAFEVRNWRFVVLDTQDLAIQGGWAESSEQYKQSVVMMEGLQTAGRPNAQDYNGGFSEPQLQWLDAQLADADKQHQSVIVFGHLPLMPPDDRHIAWNADQTVAVFEKHPCLMAYFCGHQHGGGYTFRNDIHYVTFEAMVNAADDQGAWATVEILPDRIVINGTGAVTSRTLELR